MNNTNVTHSRTSNGWSRALDLGRRRGEADRVLTQDLQRRLDLS